MKMTWLEALNEVAKGKRMRQKEWNPDKFVFLGGELGTIYVQTDEKTVMLDIGGPTFLSVYDWEEYEKKMDFLSACRLLQQDRTREMRRACWPKGMVLQSLPDGLTYNGHPWEGALSEMLATDWVVF